MTTGKDRNGNDRIVGGTVDMGAYETEAADEGVFRGNFMADIRRGTAPFAVQFTASVAGENLEAVTYWWDFGDGTTAPNSTPTFAKTYANPGIFTVSLIVSNLLNQSATVIKERHIVSGPLTWYVSPEGNAIAPYNDWDSALPDIHWAFENAGSNDTIYLAGRDYPLTHTLTFDKSYVTVKGGYEAGSGMSPGDSNPDLWPTRITRDPSQQALRLFTLEEAKHTSFENISFEGGRSFNSNSQLPGGGLFVKNCQKLVFTRCRINDNSAVGRGGGIYSLNSSATFRNGEISLNSLHTIGWQDIQYGGGAYIEGGEWETRVVTIKGIPVHGRLADVTVSDGYTERNWGGGIGIWGSQVAIDGVRITNNRMHGPSVQTINGQGYGAGIGGVLSTVSMTDCSVVSNYASCASWDGVALGGGIGIHQGAWTICRTTIAFNEANGNTRSRNYGGGMLVDGGTHRFENVLIFSNRCNKVGSQTITIYNGDGVYVHNTSLYQTRACFQNCTLANNEGQGLFVADIAGGVDPAFTTLTNCILWGNSVDVVGAGSKVIAYSIGVTGPVSVAWSDSQELHAGPENSVEDPLFVGDGDYHLRSKVGRWTQNGWVKDNVHSPCIDAGSRATPVGDEPQPNSNRINLGTYGGTAQASLSVLPGTFFIIR